MNAMSGIAIAITALAAYAVAREIGAGRWVALFATLWFAFTQDVWAHAARAEAQDLAVACEAIAIYAFLRWMRTGEARWFAGAFTLCGLAMAAHPNALWLLPGLLIGTLVAARKPSLRLAALSVALMLGGLALYLYLPLRSAYVVAHGLDPTVGLQGVNGGIFWNYNDPRTLHGLALELTGSQFHTPGYFAEAFNPLRIGDALWAFVTGTQAAVWHVCDLLGFGRGRGGVATELAHDACALRCLHGGIALLHRLSERERRRPLSSPRVVAGGSIIRRASCRNRKPPRRRCYASRSCSFLRSAPVRPLRISGPSSIARRAKAGAG